MLLTREQGSGNIIRSFSAGALRINDTVFTDHVIVTADAIIENWSPASIPELSMTDLDVVLGTTPELILLGTGTTQIFPPCALMTDILRRGVGLEVMDTAAACRTFNILAGDRRQVVAALLVR